MEPKEILHDLSFLNNKEYSYNIKLTTSIDQYLNKTNKECINQFEIIEYLGRGLMWKAYKVKAYFYDKNKEICSEIMVLRKSHIRTLINMRYYIKDTEFNYFNNVLEEIAIHNILHNNFEVVRMYEVLYNPSNNIEYKDENQYIYTITEFCDYGPLMIKNFDDCNYYYNYNVMKYYALNVYKEYKYLFDTEYNNNFQIITESQINNDDANKTTYIKDILNENISCKLPYNFLRLVYKDIFLKIVLSLKLIHSHNIVYSDLKPENIIFTSLTNNNNNNSLKEIYPKIIDFSISTRLDNSQSLVCNIGGTTCFQAPEQFDSFYNGFKSDIWSFGILSYLFLTTQLPLDSESDLDIQIKILKGHIEYPSYVDNKILYILKNILTNDISKRLNIDNIIEEIKNL